MTRWTVNEDGNPEWSATPFRLDITRHDLRYDLWGGPAADTVDDAHAALVAAVRDAELLAQARDMARHIRAECATTDDINAHWDVPLLLDLLTGEQE